MVARDPVRSRHPVHDHAPLYIGGEETDILRCVTPSAEDHTEEEAHLVVMSTAQAARGRGRPFAGASTDPLRGGGHLVTSVEDMGGCADPGRGVIPCAPAVLVPDRFRALVLVRVPCHIRHIPDTAEAGVGRGQSAEEEGVVVVTI